MDRCVTYWYTCLYVHVHVQYCIHVLGILLRLAYMYMCKKSNSYCLKWQNLLNNCSD